MRETAADHARDVSNRSQRFGSVWSMVACVATAMVLMGLVVPMPTASSAEVTLAAGGSFVSVAPIRVMDTRIGLGGPPMGERATRRLPLAPPAGATAVVLNVTATNPSRSTFITVWPAGTGQPRTSNVNVVAGETRPNAVIVGLGAGGAVELFNDAGSVDVVVDVMGWYTAGFNSIVPDRFADTRQTGGVPLGAGRTMQVQVAGRGAVPSSAVAVVVNITADRPTAASYLSAWPSGQDRPPVSNLNFVPGQTVPNLAIIGVGSGGSISLFNNAGTTEVIVDVMGWFDASSGLTPVGPDRVLDTRAGTCGFRLGQGETRTLRVTTNPAVGAVALNLTADTPSADTYVAVRPAGSPSGTTSNLNVLAGQASTPNFVVVGVGPAGEIQLYNNRGSVDLIVDVFASFAGTTPAGAPTPCPVETGATADLNPYPTMYRAVGTDTFAVYVCRVPLGTTHPDYTRAGAQRVAITPDDVVRMGSGVVADYFAAASRNRYRVVFTPVGYIDLAAGDGRVECRDKAMRLAAAPFTNVLAVDDTTVGGGFAGAGYLDPNSELLASSPRNSSRGAFVGGGSIITLPTPSVVAHEIGHTLHWPHSYVGPSEYDNPVDLMSGFPAGNPCTLGLSQYPCRPQHTLAINRYFSGWIDDGEVAIHRRGTSTANLAAPTQPGTALLVAMSADRRLVLTLEARPATGIDAGLTTAGVALHVADQRSCGLGFFAFDPCISTLRRHGPALGRPNSYDHVVRPGETISVHGLTVTVNGVAGTGYNVTVTGAFDGANFAWPVTAAAVSSIFEPDPPPPVTSVDADLS